MANTGVSALADDLVANARLDMSTLPTSKQLSLRGRIRACYCGSALRLLLEECGSLPFRIARSLEMREEERRGYKGLCHSGRALPLARRPQKLACIQYMQQLQIQRPRLTCLTISDWDLAEQS
jgi:hypothetical protein